jgi:putative protease
MKRVLELLAPARNLECGIAAIDHGADAVYIGARRFGARASAGNSLDDIQTLCVYAHQFGAKVYVTVNTIIYDNEIEETRNLLRELEKINVDAILVQDMGLLTFKSVIALHASTQTDNRTPEKVAWLRDIGFSRVVLARELSISEIASIHKAVPEVELEVFVHGALCVSYSGLCYASQHCFNRSANRGECAQFCRMKFDLTDNEGKVIERNRYLLSLKDLNQSDNLERLIEAGASSFKIEGRLKDVTYVKNVTAAYNKRLNDIVDRYPDMYARASLGRCQYTFTPNLSRTFNRGYTSYFANGRKADIMSFDTPKAIGEYVGFVKEIRGNAVIVAGTARFSNGDGLCYINNNRELEGFRVNKVEYNRLYPFKKTESLRPGMRLYRNNDQEMEHLLIKQSAQRKIPVTMVLGITNDGFSLTLDGVKVSMTCKHVMAQTPQREIIIRQLSKLGSTPFTSGKIELPEDFNYFIPGNLLNELRRRAVEKRLQEIEKHVGSKRDGNISVDGRVQNALPPIYRHSVFYNIANHLSRQFYEQQGLQHPSPAFELKESAEAPIMQCRHCLRFALGFCVKNGGSTPKWKEPLFLRLGDGRHFRLEFDCSQCQMNIFATNLK